MDGGPSLPHLAEPYDAIRHGISSLKADALPAHPVEAILKNSAIQQAQTKRLLMERAYGAAFPMKMDIERQILSSCQRLPGLPSSMLGLESLTGSLDDFGFEDYLGGSRDSEYGSQLDLHTTMECNLGISQGPAVAHKAIP